ncbi:glycine oxidase ThiO [Nitriliruptor alkaliphilus]|uniref:glycine oxidase ThiO n=1 Tax=Nitriliruptor alkaliphilus TaxID=427918 RepID=UPI0006975FB2|nr:glycine oxidase ThiO [Nitriliruptor alkaliphilus]
MTGPEEVVVVGAGVIGTSCAWSLARDGLTVTLVDPEPFRGASYVAAGMLAPISELTAGHERLAELGLASLARWPAFAANVTADGGVDPELRSLSTVTVALTRADLAMVDEHHARQGTHGSAVTRLRSRELREHEPLLAPGVVGGSVTTGEAAVDTRKVGAGLTGAAGACGVRTVADAVARLDRDADGQVRGVTTAGGDVVRADAVVVAAGHRTTAVLAGQGHAAPEVRPVKGQILRLRGPAGALGHQVRAIVHGRQVYVVPRADGRLVVGATVEERGEDRSVTAGAVRELLDDASAVLPFLDECELIEATAGLRPATVDDRPVIGPAGSGLVIATGHHRGGVLLAPLTADLVVAAVRTGRAVPGFEDVAPDLEAAPWS